ncbi:hypothetical protein EDC02_5617 [Micromonospora sp. Llam0]|nr:hypothetical protein EDC02_5617 [Micromonospora sp. Llam0]
MKQATRVLSALAASALALGGVVAAPAQAVAGPAEAAVAVPGIAPPDSASTAIYLDSAGRVIPMTTAAGTTADTALIGCTPESGRDNPHRSGTGVAVSGHGWWRQGNCSNDRANVFNCLYEWYTDNSWRQKACSSTRELRPYTGSGDRTVARHDCDDTQLTSWRNHVDVDVIGEIDTGEWPYRQNDVACRVY